MKYRALWVPRLVMPDDRLAWTRTDDSKEPVTFTWELRRGYVHPGLAHALQTVSAGLATSGMFHLDLFRDIRDPKVTAWFELVDEDLMGDLPLRMHNGGAGSEFYLFLIQKGLADPALIRELNEEATPRVCGLLVPHNNFATPPMEPL